MHNSENYVYITVIFKEIKFTVNLSPHMFLSSSFIQNKENLLPMLMIK